MVSQCEIIHGRLPGKLFAPFLPRAVKREARPEQYEQPGARATRLRQCLGRVGAALIGRVRRDAARPKWSSSEAPSV